MKNRFIFTFICSCLLFTSYLGYSQCGGESVTNIGGGYCNNQNPEFQITPTASGVNYNWFVTPPVSTTASFSSGYYFVGPSPISSTSGAVNYYYQKLVSTTGGPGLATTTGFAGAGLLNDKIQNYQINYSSTTDFYLNYVTASIFSYSINASSIYGLKVRVGSNFSTIYTFTGSNFVSKGSNLYTIQIPLRDGLGNIGIRGSAGNNSIQIIANDGTFTAPGLNQVDNFAWYNSSFFNSTYSINSTLNLNVGLSTNTALGSRVPGLYDYNVTIICNTSTVTSLPVTTGCCAPIATPPNFSSSIGGNVVVSPISPNVVISATGLSSAFYYQWYFNGSPLAGSSGVGINTISVNQTGKYTVRVVTSSGFINRLSCYKENTFWLQERELFAIVNNPQICLGQNTTLYASGATGTVNWVSGTNLSSTTSPGPTFTATSPGIYNYTVTGVVPVGNQILNGDFEQGYIAGTINPSGGYTYSNLYAGATTPPSWACYPDPSVYPQFYSGSTWLLKGGANWNNASFSVGYYVPFLNYNGAFPCKDHTTGNGQYFFTDAASTNTYSSGVPPPSARYFWSQTVIVQPNTDYEFAGWFASYTGIGDAYKNWGTVCGSTGNDPGQNPPPFIDIMINDMSILPSVVTVTSSVCQWQKVGAVWNSGNNSGSVTLKITNWNLSNYGNDFVMDDISFGAPGTQTDIATITVTDCNFINVVSSSTCSGKTATITANTNGIFSNWTTTAGGTNGITSPTSITTTVTTSSSNYVFNATAKFLFGNMLTNGDFSSGNSGFTSSYGNVASGPVYGGQYAITSTPSNRDTSPFVFLDKLDKTGGATRNMMLVNANKGNGAVIYSTTISGIQAGREYGFSMWLANVNQVFTNATPDTSNSYPNPKTANVEILVNGTSLGRIKQPLDTVWRQYGGLWTAPSSANAVIQIVNRETLGSDISGFVMDDLKFSTTYAITKTATVTSPICALSYDKVYLEGKILSNGNQLTWFDSDNSSTAQYLIERSTDGNTFIPIGQLSSKGYTNTFIDPFDQSNIQAYYRVTRVSDKTFPVQSNTIYLTRVANGNYAVFPNPSNSSFTLAKSSPFDSGTITISTLEGKTIETFTQLSETITFGSDYLSGVYIVKIVEGNTNTTFKIIKN